MALEHQTFQLSDQRIMGYAVYGVVDGLPIVVCHGTPGSRLMLRLADSAAKELGLCIIAPDRPGYGLSSRRTNWQLSDWTEDVIALADALSFKHFTVVGISGGGPFALACAYQMPERVRLVAVISGLAPIDQEEVLRSLNSRHLTVMRAARGRSLLLRAVLMLGSCGWRHLPTSLLEHIISLAPGTEELLMAKPLTQRDTVASIREAFRSGSAGVAHDLSLFSRPWGFSVAQIAVPALLWHGEADAIVPAAMGHYLAGHLPNCAATFIPDAGHYWIMGSIETVLMTLLRRLADE